MGCRVGKLGSRELRSQLPQVSHFLQQFDLRPRTLVACDTGDDLAIGVALALLCLFYDKEGK